MADDHDSSIPVLTDVLVAGAPDKARSLAQWRDEQHAGGGDVHEAAVEAGTPASVRAPGATATHASAVTAAVTDAVAAASTPSAMPDAERIAERLRGRVGAYLTGEGRELIEARCREALAEHAGWLISHVTREVALALETQMQAWVREVVSEEMQRRAAPR